MLIGAVGQSKPASVWCFEPVCESGRTLLMAQRSVAFRRRWESTRRNVWFLFCVHAPRRKELYADTIFALLWH